MVQYREKILSTGKIIYLGKNAENNDCLVETAKPQEVLLHTAAPGSPFCNLSENPTKKEIKEAAVFTAMKSQIWRDSKSDVIVHLFLKKDTYKENKMKEGTWGIKIFKEIRVKKGDILRLEDEIRN